ncbi:MAG: chemotaxis protein CheW [Thermotoga sp.]|nr:MAG: chemotaxis protein CheW [Thermotoga sp.]
MIYLKVVTFNIGDGEYALDINYIESVVDMLPITRVPEAPHEVEGIINLRGEVMPLINSSKLLGVESRAESKGKIIILNYKNRKFGFLVDEIREVIDVSEEDVEPVDERIGVGGRYIDGIIKRKDKLVILLKPSLASEEVFSTGVG